MLIDAVVCAPDPNPANTGINAALDRIKACKGPGLVLDADLSMQLVMSQELQALVREAGLSVELQCDRPCLPLLRDDWLRLSIPVRHRPDCSACLHDFLGFHTIPCTHACQYCRNGTVLLSRYAWTLQVLSVRWRTGNADAWAILENCAWPTHDVAAIYGLQLPFTAGRDAARRLAAKFYNLRSVRVQ